MTAAELSSMKKTKPRMASWAIKTGESISRSSSMCPGGCGGPPAPESRHGAAPFAHVRLVLRPKMFQRGERGRGGGVAEGAQRLADDQPGDVFKQGEVLHLSFAALDL